MFGRRRRHPLPAGERVSVTFTPLGTVPDPVQAPGYVRGWAPAAALHPSQQIGMFSGSAVTFRGGSTLEIQKRQGVESTSAEWYIPPQMVTTTGGPLNLAGAGNVGAQRVNGGAAGGLGPITARTMRGQVTAAQIRQSGLAAVQWAQTLTPQA